MKVTIEDGKIAVRDGDLLFAEYDTISEARDKLNKFWTDADDEVVEISMDLEDARDFRDAVQAALEDLDDLEKELL